MSVGDFYIFYFYIVERVKWRHWLLPTTIIDCCCSMTSVSENFAGNSWQMPKTASSQTPSAGESAPNAARHFDGSAAQLLTNTRLNRTYVGIGLNVKGSPPRFDLHIKEKTNECFQSHCDRQFTARPKNALHTPPGRQ